MSFDYRGTIVRKSQPVTALKRITKVLTIDSRDRDPTKFVRVPGGAAQSDPGDYVVYLPRVYENVTQIRLKSAAIGAPTANTPILSSNSANSGTAGFAAADQYVLVSIEGLNRNDETAPGADRSGHVDSYFAKIMNYPNTAGAASTATIFYSDSGYDENITRYTPPVSKLDRMHITIRRHPAWVQPNVAATVANPFNAPIVFGTAENNFTFEIEYLDNVFEDVSSFETRLNAEAC
jgi:hypothetical protein